MCPNDLYKHGALTREGSLTNHRFKILQPLLGSSSSYKSVAIRMMKTWNSKKRRRWPWTPASSSQIGESRRSGFVKTMASDDHVFLCVLNLFRNNLKKKQKHPYFWKHFHCLKSTLLVTGTKWIQNTRPMYVMESKTDIKTRRKPSLKQQGTKMDICKKLKSMSYPPPHKNRNPHPRFQWTPEYITRIHPIISANISFIQFYPNQAPNVQNRVKFHLHP